MKQSYQQAKIRRKNHYDNKVSINLMVSEGGISGSIQKADIDNHFALPSSYHQGFGIDEDQAFIDNHNDEIVMAKAYDDYTDTIELKRTTAKAYSNEKIVPQDTTNEYSDVFKMDDDSLFDSVITSSSENSEQVESLSNQVEDDDEFARDLQAVLSGKKSLANLAHHTEKKETSKQKTPQEEVDPVKQVEKKMAQQEAVFDQIAADRNRITTYQLGDVELTSIFDEADDNLESNKIATAKNRVEDIIDEQSMAMSGMEYAEDFEVIESIVDKEQTKSKAPSDANSSEEAEDVIEIDSDDNE